MSTDNHRAARQDMPSGSGGQVAVSPAWGQPSRRQQPATTRTRRIVDTLPPWEPVPPGEILVNRSRER